MAGMSSHVVLSGSNKLVLSILTQPFSPVEPRVTEDEFMEWWAKHDPTDALRKKLGKQISDKLE